MKNCLGFMFLFFLLTVFVVLRVIYEKKYFDRPVETIILKERDLAIIKTSRKIYLVVPEKSMEGKSVMNVLTEKDLFPFFGQFEGPVTQLEEVSGLEPER